MSVLSPSTLNSTGVVVRAVSIATDTTVTTTNPGTSFRCALLPPKNTKQSTSVRRQSPRDVEPKLDLWWLPSDIYPGGPALDVSYRVEIDDAVYELTTDGRAMRAGPRIYGYHADCLALSDLYPFEGEIQELGGEVVQSNVPIAMWRPALQDRTASRGAYEDLQAEVPAEYWNTVREEANRQIVIGGVVYRISGPDLHVRAPHVTMGITSSEY